MLNPNHRACSDSFYNKNLILMHKYIHEFADAILSDHKCALIR